MKAGVLLTLLVLGASTGALTGTLPARAEEQAPAACEVPAYLLSSESRLPKVGAATRENRALDILVVGSGSSTIPSAEDGAYPARMEAVLKQMLPDLPVRVSVELQRKKTAEETADGFVKLMEAKKPTLVVWQTGTFDALTSVDPDEFRNAVGKGVVALQEAGADVILMNLQYSPRTETMTAVPPYLDNIRVVAQEHDVPLFDRFSIMRNWNEQGDFDLFSATHGIELAKRVHDCLGRALAKFIVEAARPAPEQQN